MPLLFLKTVICPRPAVFYARLFIKEERRSAGSCPGAEAAEVEAEMEGLDVSAERKREIVERRLRSEINRGVQTIQYQVVTLMTTNGQAPFITVFMYLGEARNAREKADLAIIIEETIRQRYQGVKNEAGVWITRCKPDELCNGIARA